jgi:DNA-binding MarR family transcriptional regulator
VETTTRWLTEEEQRVWRQFLTACQSLFGGIDAQLLRDSALPHGYYEILVRLSETPGRALRMTQLAAASTFSKSRLSHAVSRLEQRGLVIREDCATDRRGQIARLTDAGMAVLEAAAPGHVEQVRRSLIDVLTPDQVRQLGEISGAMIAAAAPGAASGCQEADEAMDADAPTACQEADEAMGGCGRFDDELD